MMKTIGRFIFCLCVGLAGLALGAESGGLVGYWPLDEGQGAVVHDRSGGNHDGRLAGASWLREGSLAVLNFDPGQYVTIPHQETFNVTEAFTISAWINLTTLLGEQGIMSKGRTNMASGFNFFQEGGRLVLMLATERKPGMGIQGMGYILQTRPMLKEKTWAFVAVTYDSRQEKACFYIDGQLVQEAQTAGRVVYQMKGMQENVDYPRLPLVLGSMSVAVGHYLQFNGFLREVKLFNRVLSPDEIRQAGVCGAAIREIRMEREEEKFQKTLTAAIRVKVRDEISNEPLCCRVTVKGAGRNYFPAQGISYGKAKDGYFYSSGETEVRLPPGSVEVSASRGYEYEPAKASATVAAGDARDLEIRMKRLVNWPERGWFCGEHHIHALGHGKRSLDVLFGDTRETAEQGFLNACRVCQGEGLNFAHFVTAISWEIGPRYSDLVKEKDFIGYSGCEGGTNAGGHVCQVNRPKAGGAWAKKGLFSNMDMLDWLQSNGGIGVFAHPYSGAVDNPGANCVAREIPLGIALGKVFVWDVFSWGDLKTATRDWYRYLNLGFKVGAAAGTDTYLNSNGRPGALRVYCKLEALGWPEVVKSYRERRTFVTDGPLLFFTVNGKDVGDTLIFDGMKKENLALHLEAFSMAGLEKVEVIKNGEPVKSLTAEGRELKTDFALEIGETCWLALRVAGKKGPECGGLALSSPVYVQFGSQPMQPAGEDVEYFVDWLEKYKKTLPALARRYNENYALASDLIRNIDRALEVYKSLKQSPRSWVGKDPGN
ncbi:MAG: CehA/McbA family metallohydrolase [Verrucomicrobiae bacterium]|nr:CehA/McbA family metallohydrolase [Verrucomicrobiae bacterium]